MRILMAEMKGFRLVLLKQSHLVPLPTSSKFIRLQLLWLEFMVLQIGFLLRNIKIKKIDINISCHKAVVSWQHQGKNFKPV